MTIRTTRTLLLSNLLRSGQEKRIARLFDRMTPAELSEVLLELGALELRHAARVLFGGERVDAAVTELDPRALAALVAGAVDDDAVRALDRLPGGPAARILLALPERRRTRLFERMDPKARRRLQRHLPRARRDPEGLRPVLRLRRLFA